MFFFKERNRLHLDGPHSRVKTLVIRFSALWAQSGFPAASRLFYPPMFSFKNRSISVSSRRRVEASDR